MSIEEKQHFMEHTPDYSHVSEFSIPSSPMELILGAFDQMYPAKFSFKKDLSDGIMNICKEFRIEAPPFVSAIWWSSYHLNCNSQLLPGTRSDRIEGIYKARLTARTNDKQDLTARQKFALYDYFLKNPIGDNYGWSITINTIRVKKTKPVRIEGNLAAEFVETIRTKVISDTMFKESVIDKYRRYHFPKHRTQNSMESFRADWVDLLVQIFEPLHLTMEDTLFLIAKIFYINGHFFYDSKRNTKNVMDPNFHAPDITKQLRSLLKSKNRMQR